MKTLDSSAVLIKQNGAFSALMNSTTEVRETLVIIMNFLSV